MERLTQRNLLLMSGFSRIVVLIMQVLFNWVNEDHQPDVFNPPAVADEDRFFDKAVEFLLGGFRRWDSIYFIHIAEHGYTYENTLAFFPCFPLLVRAVGFSLLYPLHSLMSCRHVLMTGAFMLNTLAFVVATWYLYKLAKELIGKGNHPWFTAVLFCFNPASIFMSAAYTETLFAMSSFAFMYYMETRKTVHATVALVLATATRSNGVVLVGYPIYLLLKLPLSDKHDERRMFNMTRSWVEMVTCILYGILPFFLFQYAGFVLYCQQRKLAMPRSIEAYGIARGYHLPFDTPNEWCNYTIPIPYTYIQKNHWNVGVFNYYEIKQLPNFLLATPVVMLSFFAMASYLYKCKDSLMELRSLRPWLHSRPMKFFPHVIHLLFLVLYGIFNVHIQVLTRLIFSSSPLIYSALARHISQYFMRKQTSTFLSITVTYFTLYFVIGTYMHSNFLPWT